MMPAMADLTDLRDPRSPQVLVENRTSVGGDDLQFSIYDTYQPAQSVALHASSVLYCGMVTGRKRIHVDDEEGFDFLPAESLVVPRGRSIDIDFPEASTGEPTTCVTLAIRQEKVKEVIDRMNETMPRSPASGVWSTQDQCAHFQNTASIESLLKTLVQLFAEDHPYRDALIDLNATQLILRLLQAEAREVLLRTPEEHAASHGIAAAVQYAHDHLDRHITVGELAEVACMSRSTFYRYFRDEFGMTPLTYLNEKRMERAKTLLRDDERTVTEVSYELGFRSVSHFITKFRDAVGVTPKTFQEREAKA